MTTAYNNIGLNYAAAGNNTKALEYFNKALKYYNANGGNEDKITEPIYTNIAGLYAEKGEYANALLWHSIWMRHGQRTA